MSHLLQVPCQQLRVRATLLKTVPSSRLTKPKPFGGPRTCSKPLSAKRTRLDLRRRLRLKSLPLLRKTPSLEPSRTGNHWPLNSVKNILDISSAHEALNKAEWGCRMLLLFVVVFTQAFLDVFSMNYTLSGF